jgi:hypothetical protein
MRARAVLAAGIAMLASAAGRAHADEGATRREVRFSLSVGEGGRLDACGGATAVRSAVEARLRRAAFANGDPADIALHVEVDAAWRAHIVERDRDGAELGRRDVPLAAGDCGKSVDTLAVVLAIMIGPPRTITDETAPPPPEPAPEAATPPPIPPPKPVAPPSVPPRSLLSRLDEGPPRWRISPVVEFAGGTGVLPELSFGVQGGVIVRPPVRRLSLMARGAYWPARSTETAAAAEVDRASGALLSCFSLLPSIPSSFAACGGVEAGRLHSTSIVLTRASETAVFLDVFVEGRLGYRFARAGDFIIEPVLAAQIAAVLRRDRFTYRDRAGQERTLLQPAPVAFQASLGLAVHFL